MQSVLVTGGAGFAGSHLVEALVERGCAVTVLDDLSDGYRSNLAAVAGKYRLVVGDVRDPDLLGQLDHVDTIFHLAANANVPRSVEAPVDDGSINILGTVNMLNLARRTRARFFLASSAAVYGEPVAPPMAEDHAIAPISPYGVSKLSAERYVELYKRLYDVQATIVRFFNMFGPRQRRYVVYDFAHKIRRSGDEVVILGDGRQVRTQLFIADAVRALLTVADRGTEPVYNIGSERSFSVTELMERMLALFGAAKRLTMSQVSWDGDIQRLVPDISRLRDLGFREAVSLDDGLAAFKAWFETEYAEVSV